MVLLLFNISKMAIKLAPKISHFGVLVGAFCKIGRADTGKPVQIYSCFVIFGVFLKL